MNVNLKKYQQEALRKLVDETSRFLDREGMGEVIVFQAPTGSGKTVVMARFIEEIIKERRKDNLCFLWLSIGKGDLHIQSKNSLSAIFEGAPKVTLVDEEFGSSRNEIAHNEVVVGNWEKLNKKDRDGNWKVILMKDGEFVNFREVLENTQAKRRIILIIDESQIGAGAPRVSEVRELVGAEVVIEVSATPKISEDLFSAGSVAKVSVEAKDVIEQGMIKKELIINPGLREIAKSDDVMEAQNTILELAYDKRREISGAFKKIGSDVNPLVIVQIPDKEAGDIRKEAVLKFLATKGETVTNGKVGVWLSGEKTENLDGITRNDDNTNFLIFKQAINVGWDCPRAHILVKLREVSGSESFEIQTVGRILRMPERKHYGDDLLNIGYIYSNAHDIRVKPDEYKMDIIKSKWARRKTDYKQIKLPSEYLSRLDYGDVKANFSSLFEKAAKNFFGVLGNSAPQNVSKLKVKGVKVDLDVIKQSIVADTGIDTREFDQMGGHIRPESFAKLSLSADEMELRFYDFIKTAVREAGFGNIARSTPIVAEVIYGWFEEYLGARKWPEWILMVQCMVINSSKPFMDVLNQAFKLYKEVREKDLAKRANERSQTSFFDVPEIEYFNEQGDEAVSRIHKYAQTPCYLSKSRSQPEKDFEDLLEENGDKIDWWYKNGENKKEYFGITYERSDGEHTFYPDYIVRFGNGRIGIFETKDEKDQEGSTVTKAKAETLAAWIAGEKRKDLFGGIVVNRHGQWLLNDKKTYNWGDWSDWNKLEI